MNGILVIKGRAAARRGYGFVRLGDGREVFVLRSFGRRRRRRLRARPAAGPGSTAGPCRSAPSWRRTGAATRRADVRVLDADGGAPEPPEVGPAPTSERSARNRRDRDAARRPAEGRPGLHGSHAGARLVAEAAEATGRGGEVEGGRRPDRGRPADGSGRAAGAGGGPGRGGRDGLNRRSAPEARTSGCFSVRCLC